MAWLADWDGEQRTKVNTGKTKVMVSRGRGTQANIKDSQRTSLRRVNTFKYLGFTISEVGGSEEAAKEQDLLQRGASGETYPELSVTRK